MKKSFLLLFSFCLYSCSDYASDYENVWGNFFSGEITEEDLFSSSSSVQSFDNYPSPISSSDFFNDYNPIASSSSSVNISSSSELESSSSDVLTLSSSSEMLILSSSSIRYSSSSEVIINSLRDSRDGQTYKYIMIGNQVWMAENLNYETANSYCSNDNSTNCEKYGRLYEWSAALNACPSGWHLPTAEEVETLLETVGGKETAGKMLKSTIGWDENGNGVDAFGFSVLPAGYRLSSGYFCLAGEDAYFWSATEHYEGNAYSLALGYLREDAHLYSNYKDDAYSVRCLRD